MLKVEAEIIMHRALIADHVFRSCLNCDHWGAHGQPNKETDTACSLYGAPPPAVIVYACPKWLPDIPF